MPESIYGDQKETLPLVMKHIVYEIKKYKSGYYFLINIEASDDKAIKEFDRLATLDENILRHIIIKL